MPKLCCAQTYCVTALASDMSTEDALRVVCIYRRSERRPGDEAIPATGIAAHSLSFIFAVDLSSARAGCSIAKKSAWYGKGERP